jgi:DNA N-6-adenine-methyltransferase (Dam)
MTEFKVGDRVSYAPNCYGVVQEINALSAILFDEEGKKFSVGVKNLELAKPEIEVGDKIYYGEDQEPCTVLQVGYKYVVVQMDEEPRKVYDLRAEDIRHVEGKLFCAKDLRAKSDDLAITVQSEVVTENDLSGVERATLQNAEIRIEKGLQSFLEIGAALKQIQQHKLYRADYSTFEQYLETRWGMSREQGYRNISAATVAQNLLPIGNIPTAESQVRLLSPLPEEQQREVWADAIKRTITGAPTAATVATVLAERGLKVPKSALPKSGFTEPDRDSDELYTPPDFLESVYACLGEIDLDPCSNSLEEPNVRAKSHYTRAIDGLGFQRIWAGKIFMNPPYSAPRDWVERLLEEHSVGEVDEAICLLPVDPSTGWWQALRDHPVCLISRRLHFVGGTSSARFASAAFYLGSEVAKFHQHFGGWGEIRQTLEVGMFGE